MFQLIVYLIDPFKFFPINIMNTMLLIGNNICPKLTSCLFHQCNFQSEENNNLRMRLARDSLQHTNLLDISNRGQSIKMSQKYHYLCSISPSTKNLSVFKKTGRTFQTTVWLICSRISSYNI